jgi:hypothetical protein
MGLHQTAHYLKTKGRGKDTELVHMTPKEIKGLQALAMAHGGSLTTNPNTGLPEAGFLEDILPIVAAAGLTYLTAGAAAPTLTAALGGSAMAGGIAAGALSGAAISGGMAAIQGKDAGKAALMGGLGGGISGGLGAYDAANVFNAPNLLADASQQVATTAGTEAGAEISKQALGSAGTPQSFDYSPSGEMIPTGTGAAPVGVGAAPSSTNTELLNQMARGQGVFPEGSAALPGTEVTGQTSLAPGFQQPNIPSPSTQSLFDQEAQSRGGAARTIGIKPDTFYDGLNKYEKVGVQALPVIGLLQDKQQQVGPEDTYDSRLKRISPDFRAYEPPRPNPYYRAQYAADGGVMSSFDDEPDVAMATGGATQLPKGDPGIYRDADPTTRGQDAFTAALTRLNSIQKRANIKGLPALKAAAPPLSDIPEAAGGGIMSSLGGYSDGGRMLKGPGDGMSDSIPGVIGKKQPARLADGEFVVPADVVSHLGNGSTDAGAKKLYAMMDNIRKARTGKKKQAPAVKADRYMPA